MDEKKFATVQWTVADIKMLRPEWTDEKCEEFLCCNERRIRERLVELGWGVLESFLNLDLATAKS